MIWLGAYLLGYVLLWRRVTWYIIQDLSMGDPNPDGDCLVGGAVVGSIFTFGWPLIAIGIAVRRIFQARGQSAVEAFKPRHVKRKEREKQAEREMRARERRVAEMERDLGIDLDAVARLGRR